MEEVKDNINEGVDIKGRAEEDPNVAERNSNSETMENKSEDHGSDEEVVDSSAGNKGHKVTEEDSKGEHNESDNSRLGEDIGNLFVDRGSGKSTIDNMATNKGNTKMSSGNKRKAENDDDITDNGKKQKGDNKE